MIQNNNSIKFDLDCMCGCTSLKFTNDTEDNFVTITQYVPNFYVKQNGIFFEMLRRIKFAYYILIGKEFYMYDMIIENEEIKEFKDWVSKI